LNPDRKLARIVVKLKNRKASAFRRNPRINLYSKNLQSMRKHLKEKISDSEFFMTLWADFWFIQHENGILCKEFTRYRRNCTWILNS